MDNESSNPSIRDKVAAAVKNGQLKMRPKWHFALKTILWATGIVIAILALLYFSSLFVFITWRSGIWIVPFFGWHGILVFLSSIPWLLLLFAAVFAIILEILVRHYAFGWRQPLIYVLIAILLMVAVGGTIVALTPFHGMISHCPPPRNGFLMFNDPILVGRPPCGQGMYRDLDPRRFGNVNKGMIVEFAAPNVIIQDWQGQKLKIFMTPRTRLPFGSDFSVGDTVIVVGDRRGSQVEAFGISEVPD